MRDDATQGSQRRHARVDIPLLVQYRFGPLEDFRTDYALNVSASGMFVATSETRPPGTSVFVQLTTRDGQHFLQGEGRVVRSADGGHAIELVGFAPEARAVLEKLVEEAVARAARAPDPGPRPRRGEPS